MLFGYAAETAMIVCGAIVVILISMAFSNIATVSKEMRFWLFVLANIVFIGEFPSAKIYVLEMYPDLLALCFFAWGVVTCDKWVKGRKKYQIVITMLLWYIAALFKQTAVALYLGLGLTVLFSKKIDIKEKLIILSTEFVSGILLIGTIIINPGCWESTITVNAGHDLLPIQDYYRFGVSTCRNNWMFITLLLIYVVLLFTKKRKLEGLTQEFWLGSSLSWFVFCMYGAAKDGANEGNMEAAMMTFMPFVLI